MNEHIIDFAPAIDRETVCDTECPINKACNFLGSKSLCESLALIFPRYDECPAEKENSKTAGILMKQSFNAKIRENTVLSLEYCTNLNLSLNYM